MERLDDSTEKSLPCFIRVEQRVLLGYEEQTIFGVDVGICLHSCLHMSSFYCASVNYDELKKMCTLNGGSVYFNDVELKNSTTDYYENECNHVQALQRIVSNTATLGPGTTRPTTCFEAMKNSVLLSFEGNLVENTESLDDCQAACAMNNRRCGSLNWIPHRRSCMLFNIGHDMKSVVFSPNVHFLINKCAGREETVNEQRKDEYYDERFDSS
ncbi:hypothetical protein KIN20_002712 [Parelaphostrongylus tenuis]|uniref:Apple domain-containing protein n=1 Tax=Parelaphostrongylus tenuis TaxID=148309 RepID=A0AAD5M079_PARTN|nr:hypothetical protein KIN20_002712 [Parelaphostrongylus tenuis]